MRQANAEHEFAAQSTQTREWILTARTYLGDAPVTTNLHLGERLFWLGSELDVLPLTGRFEDIQCGVAAGGIHIAAGIVPAKHLQQMTLATVISRAEMHGADQHIAAVDLHR